ncbi:GyrI-like domain-containing protein [Spongiimicrobium salis]|uniref:GyrI-like domain-containing protein n=1 Tax=Spongiimicrobium salis TaxID=1667022 RepID=UPI00374D4EA6
MQPRIEQLQQKKLVGKRLSMSLVHNRTAELWAGFGPRIKEIGNRLSTDKISMQVYDKLYYSHFNPTTAFEKWATVEVADFEAIPEGLEPFELMAGPYAVFDYKGSSSDPSIFQYIFNTWLPNSGYTLDDRPHFEVLGDTYKNNDPQSEEEIWIPIKPS